MNEQTASTPLARLIPLSIIRDLAVLLYQMADDLVQLSQAFGQVSLALDNPRLGQLIVPFALSLHGRIDSMKAVIQAIVDEYPGAPGQVPDA